MLPDHNRLGLHRFRLSEVDKLLRVHCKHGLCATFGLCRRWGVTQLETESARQYACLKELVQWLTAYFAAECGVEDSSFSSLSYQTDDEKVFVSVFPQPMSSADTHLCSRSSLGTTVIEVSDTNVIMEEPSGSRQISFSTTRSSFETCLVLAANYRHMSGHGTHSIVTVPTTNSFCSSITVTPATAQQQPPSPAPKLPKQQQSQPPFASAPISMTKLTPYVSTTPLPQPPTPAIPVPPPPIPFRATQGRSEER